MSTFNYSAKAEQQNDADFRLWGSTLSAALNSAGLVQTADTGQINWVTVLKPGGSTMAGYEIWRLANSSLYFKIQYGTGPAGGNTPGLMIQVGTGSNGSGTLTGNTSDNQWWTANQNATANTALCPTYVCVTTDGFSVAYAIGANVTFVGPMGFVSCYRSVDATGATTTDGYTLSCCPTAAYYNQSVRNSPYTKGTLTNQWSLAAGSPTTSLDASGNFRAILCWADYKIEMQPMLNVCGYVDADWTRLTTKPITLFGSTSHTYLAIGRINNSNTGVVGPVNGSSATYGLAMLYE